MTPLDSLREEMRKQHLHGFIVPRADEYQGEYVPLSAERLAWISGFTGSAGVAVILLDRAVLFVDGRYTLQAEAQVDTDAFGLEHLIETPPHQWIADNIPAKSRLGYDPWLHTPAQIKRYAAAAKKAGATLVPCEINPLDTVWSDRPKPPLEPVSIFSEHLAGRSAMDKRHTLAGKLTQQGLHAIVLSAPDSVNWLLNIRGNDVPFTPFALAFAVLHNDASVDLFIDPRKIDDAVRNHLGDEVRICAPDSLAPSLDRLAVGGKTVGTDSSKVPAWVQARLQSKGAVVRETADICALPKACKNAVELEGIRAAHTRDGAAMVRFLKWFAETAPNGSLTEMKAAERLEAFRAVDPTFRGLSFTTIAGAGPNGAIVHYSVSPETDRRIETGSLFLLDSGAQYQDGTTDITRTMAVGTPTQDMREHFTRVLKGHIALARACFPAGTTGTHLDILARSALWEAGLDYDHGTGHGVGHYLSVHEGPQRITKASNTIALEIGMVISNEPGYYKTGAYGIRIENLIAVKTADLPSHNGKPFLAFETLTLAPIDRTLIETALLGQTEMDWLNAYHRRVYETLSPLLADDEVVWLADATRPLERETS